MHIFLFCKFFESKTVQYPKVLEDECTYLASYGKNEFEKIMLEILIKNCAFMLLFPLRNMQFASNTFPMFLYAHFFIKGNYLVFQAFPHACS